MRIFCLLFVGLFIATSPSYCESIKNGAGETCEILDWMHVKVYAGLNLPQNRCVVILADDLTLNGGLFSESRSSSFYIIANRLQVLAPSEISVWAQNEYLPDDLTNRGRSPDLVIATRSLKIGADGFLKLSGRGNPGGLVALYTSQTQDWEYEEPSDRKKQILKEFYDSFEYSSKLADDVLTVENSNRGHAGAEYKSGQVRAPNGELLFFRQLQRFRPAGFGSVWLSGTETSYSKKGEVRGLQQWVNADLVSKFNPWPECCVGPFDLSSVIPGAGSTLSLWSLRRLQYLTGILQTQYVAGSKPAQIQALKYAARAISEQYSISNEHMAAYSAALSSVGEFRSKIMPKVFSDTQTVSVQGRASETLTVFTENRDMKNFAAPNMALIIERKLGDKNILGLLSQSTAGDNSVALTFDAKLDLETLSSAALSARLKTAGESLDGVFSDWTLGPFGINSPGIKASTVVAAGNVLQLNLSLDPASGNIALWRLWSEAGIPITIEYSSRLDPNIRGTLTIPISFMRRASQSIQLKGRELHYLGKGYALLDYVIANGLPVIFVPSIRLDATEHANANLPSSVDLDAKIMLPVDAVRYAGSYLNWDEFDTNLGASGLIQQLRVENLLPAFDSALKLGLDYVAFTINYRIGDVASAVGPFRLAPRGVDGSSMIVSFLRPAGSNVFIEVEGSASYDGEQSKRSFKIGPIADQSIKITASNFTR